MREDKCGLARVATILQILESLIADSFLDIYGESGGSRIIVQDVINRPNMFRVPLVGKKENYWQDE